MRISGEQTMYSTSPTQYKPDSAIDSGTGHVNRASSRRSVGGTFTQSPTTGYYTRTHDGAGEQAATGKHASANSNGSAGWYGPGSPGQGRLREVHAVIPGSPVEIAGTEVPRAF
jgi:hypothetical protein